MSFRSHANSWDASSLVTPDTVLPEQYLQAPDTRRTGEIGLLWAIFVDGVQTYCRETLHGASSPEYREAERWVFRSGDGLTSFSTLCAIFDIDARRLRRQLLRFRDEPRGDLTDLLERQAA